MRIWVCDFMRTWFYGVTKMWVCAEMGLFGCLFVCQCVGMSTCSWLTAPSFHKPLRPPPLVGERGREWLPCSFYYHFARICSILLRNFITILVCFNPFGVVYQFCFGFIHT